jgi:serine/threonine-protein kinase
MSDVTRLTAALADRYRIEGELGQGGMATVYLARDLKHERDVAIKVLKPELAAVLGAERFLAEIKVTANLQHPNLLPLFDSGVADGLLYYVMPFVEGETLRARLKGEAQLPVDEAIRLVTLIAGALDFAHARGVVHRDLKPENILLQSGQPIVADFGIALAVAQAGGERITQTGLSLGTPHYMSPEQAAGERVIDARSDEYSLAAMMYEMLTGEPPHTGATSQAIIARLLTEAPRRVRATRAAVPAALDDVILRGLAKSPADRFASCGDFARAAAAAASAGTSASVSRRAPRIAVASASLAILVAAGWWVTRPQGESSGPASQSTPSIAVLPLLNLSGDSTQEYFADGMTEELTDALGRVPGLQVAARTSSFAFKGRADVDVREVGEKLGVTNVLQGSVRRAGLQLRVSVQLIDAATRRELWSARYEKERDAAFSVQDSIADAVTRRLALKFGGTEQATARGGRTNNSEAHDLYLQGLALQNQGTERSYRGALTYFREALVKDSNYAQAYVGITMSYGYLADVYMPAAIAYDSAAIAAREALVRGSVAGEVYLLQAFAEWVTLGNAPTLIRDLRRVAMASPNSAIVASVNAQMLCHDGQLNAGVAELDRAERLDRLSPFTAMMRELCSYVGRRYDDVIAAHARPAVDPNFIYFDSYLGAAYRELGRFEEALAEYRRAQVVTGDLPLFGYAVTLARAGRTREAREQLARLLAYARTHYVNPMLIAAVYASLGDRDLALASLERAATEDRTSLLIGLDFYPEFDPLRGEARYQALIKRLGLSVAPASARRR